MAENYSSTTVPRQLLLRSPTTVRPVHMRCTNTTTTDGGSADIAGANVCPSIHGHIAFSALPASMWVGWRKYNPKIWIASPYSLISFIIKMVKTARRIAAWTKWQFLRGKQGKDIALMGSDKDQS